MYSKITYGKPIRGGKPLSDEELSEFLSEPRHAILGTTNKDGTVQLTPVGFLWDGAAFYFIAGRQRHWVRRNLQRDSRMSLVIDQGDDYRAVSAKGVAEVQDEATGEMTRRILSKYFGTEYGKAFTIELEQSPTSDQILVVMHPTKIQSWGRDDEDPHFKL